MVIRDFSARRLWPPALGAVLLVILFVAACGTLVNPGADRHLVAGLSALAAETDASFDRFGRSSVAVRAADRAALDDEAIRLAAMAEARAALAPLPPRPAASATAGFMADYRRVLARLGAEDAAAGPAGPPAPILALRRAAMADAVADALVYERDVLAR